MSPGYLLSLLLAASLLAAPKAAAQAPFCDDQDAIDSAISGIARNHSYVTDGWQHACDSLLNICPELDRVWQMKAMPAIKTGDWHGCYSNLAHAVGFNAERWLPYQAFLKCLFSKDYIGAIADFNRSDTLVPGAGVMDHSYDFYRGLCWLGLKDFRLARQFLQADIERQEAKRGKDAVHYNSLYYWGLCHYLLGDYARAERELARCLKVFPQYPEPSYYLGLTLRAMGRKEEALRCFTTAKASLEAGFNSNEDQEIYINYPYSISRREVEAQMDKP